VAATIVYTAIVSWIILKLVNAIVGLRVDGDEENQGLDLVLHDERGYNL
jgi:Amt family ammonium transporter